MRKGHRPKSVCHWAEKKIVLRELWHCATPNEIAEYMYPHESDAEFATRVQDNLEHWERHYPIRSDGPGPRFFRDLAAQLGQQGNNAGNRVMNCSIAAFIAMIAEPTDRRRAWERLQSERGLGSLAVSNEVGAMIDSAMSDRRIPVHKLPAERVEASPLFQALYHNMLVSRRNFLPSVRDGARVGRLDQKHFYLTPDAAEGWFALVSADSYPTYDQCKAGLRVLVESEAWSAAIGQRQPEAVVMLAGGGAPTKDVVVIKSLLQHPALLGRRIIYYLIDISPYMLCNAFWQLSELLARIVGGERVDVKPIQDDVLELDELKSQSFRHHGNVLFGVTGGTIGNFSEESFFRALNRVSRSGDLLIVSADTMPDEETAAMKTLKSALVHKYDHPDLRRFIGPAVRSLAGELGLENPVGSVFDAVTIELDEQQKFSDVANSVSLAMNMKAGGRTVNMLSSTRYRRPELRDFAYERHWSEISEVESPSNPHFVQFFFEKL